ncbi:MAG: AmpG family muropeptide MFS transporter [Endozoicomonas sp.]
MPASRITSWWKTMEVYRHPRAITLLFLGFSAGLPLILVFGTLSFWLREAGVSRSTIGYFSWIGLAYSVKWVWSPLVDRMPLPLLSRLFGRRRAWLLLSQLCIIAGLLGMAFTDPVLDLSRMALMAVVVAFSSATQDIVIDAYRIESAEQKLQAALAATYMFGYRIAMITAGAGSLAIAAWASGGTEGYLPSAWLVSYSVMAGLMAVGLLTALVISEPVSKVSKPQLEKRAIDWMERQAHWPQFLVKILGWFYGAVVCPFADFFRRYGWHALLLLALIGTYRISDIVMGIMANPFYVDLGFTKTEVATVSKVFGVIMTLLGAAVGGIMTMRFGIMRMLFVGAVLAAITNALFSVLAYIGNDIVWLTIAISADNLSAGIATAAFIAWLSSLTNIQYSATQYALFSSMMLLVPKFLAGFSGMLVDNIGYSAFFILSALLGVPVLVLIWLANKHLPSDSGQSSKSD